MPGAAAPGALRVAQGLGMTLALCFLSMRAPAEPGSMDETSTPLTYSLEYSADPQCPSEADFVARVKQRSQRAERTRDSAPVAIDIEVTSAPPRGNLQYIEAGSDARREVEGADCDEIVSALALIVALLVDPAAEPDAPKTRPGAVQKPAPRGPSGPVSPRGVPRTLQPFIGVRGGALRGVADGFVPYLGAGAGVQSAGAGSIAPAARLDLLFAQGTANNASGTAELQWLAARAALCGAGSSQSALSWRACATFEGGRLAARGVGLASPRSAAVAWYGPGAQLGVGVRPVSVLNLSAEAGAVVNLTRDSFFFRPSDQVHQIPAVAPYFGLALEASF